MKYTIALLLTAPVAHAETLGAGPFPVFNQAYQENYAADALPDILVQAKGAYILLDPFSEEPQDWAGAITTLHRNKNEVGAYISIGTGEDWRADFAALKPFLVATPWDQWAGEYFVTDTKGTLPIMQARIDKIAAWGFDWIEFDNMDWAYDEEARKTYGFTTTVDDSVAYYRALCDYTHAKGMHCMAKNLTDGADSFDGVLYESSSEEKSWWDQPGGIAFAKAGKPVIIDHYNEVDCAGVLAEYRTIYGPTLSFICEDATLKRYVRVAE
jgi:cysteinyl-tRNA synthetase, unknown class